MFVGFKKLFIILQIKEENIYYVSYLYQKKINKMILRKSKQGTHFNK